MARNTRGEGESHLREEATLRIALIGEQLKERVEGALEGDDLLDLLMPVAEAQQQDKRLVAKRLLVTQEVHQPHQPLFASTQEG